MSYFSVGVILDANTIDDAVEEILQAYQQELKELGDNGVVTQDEKNTIKNEVIKRFTSIQLEPFCEDTEVEPYVEVSIEGTKATYNSNAKWDYFVIGGRWASGFKKKGEETKSVAVVETDTDNFKSYARIKDIEFIRSITEEDRNKLRNEYKKFTTESHSNYFKERCPSYEDYEQYITTFSTDALLTTDGKWHESEDVEYADSYSALIEKENPENYFVLVDCHI